MEWVESPSEREDTGEAAVEDVVHAEDHREHDAALERMEQAAAAAVSEVDNNYEVTQREESPLGSLLLLLLMGGGFVLLLRFSRRREKYRSVRTSDTDLHPTPIVVSSK